MRKFLLVLCFWALCDAAVAQITNNPPPPPGGPPDGPGAPVPVSGVEILFVAGAMFGGKKLWDRTRKTHA